MSDVTQNVDMGAASAAPSLISEKVPPELKERRQWVARRGKVLIDPNSGANAKTNDSSTWGTFEKAVRRADDDELDGVGFVFTKGDPYAFIDLDRCFDPEAGEIEPWASTLIETFASYTEFSTSGRGVHVVIKGEKPGGRCKTVVDGQKVELYDSRQYMAVTGEHFPGVPTMVEERQEALTGLYHELFGDGVQEDCNALTEPVSPPMSDAGVLQRCREAKNAEKFEVLYDDGDLEEYGGDHSAADQALVNLMAFWTQDEGQLDRLFRQSALMRPKWDREDYRERTIRFALPEDGDYFGAGREDLNVTFGDDFGDDKDEGAPTEKRGGAPSATVPLGVGAGPSPTPSVPAFPLDALPPVLRRLAVEAAHARETPVDFVAVPMLPALGVAIGSSRAIELSRTYRESAIVWTAVVAPPASGKSPAEDVAMEPVEHQRKVYAHEHRLALEKWKEEHQIWELAAAEARKKKKRIPPEPEKPTKKRIRVGDTTLEALLLRLTENPRGLVLGRDELAGFVNSLGQYKGGKGADREAWLSLHSGKTPPLDRKSADESHDIFYPHVSVVGSIQPSKLKVFDISAGDGLIERFLVSYPEAEIPPEAEEAYRRVWDRLHALEPTRDGSSS